ncbi:protein of unknown function (plasmid) [Cupriavidus taiwanensis]|uniref:Uncharacterized protein n=1 Tax=Cupriavidus taiwanensis TaxID=164546 RepID=A0A375ISP3_9BURK|nr:protein of unknown function [Cupriavidus taiwanensis]
MPRRNLRLCSAFRQEDSKRYFTEGTPDVPTIGNVVYVSNARSPLVVTSSPSRRCARGYRSGGTRRQLSGDVSRQEFVAPIDRMIGDVGQDVTQIGLGIDAVEFTGFDERYMAAARSPPLSAPEKNSAQQSRSKRPGLSATVRL